jgi:hypothetical protein
MKRAKEGIHGLFLLAGLLAASTAAAGYRWYYPVTISGNSVSGSLGSARNSPNAIEYIGCAVYGRPTKAWATCWAQDAAGNQVSCYADPALAPSIVTTVAALSGDGLLTFSWDASGNCTQVNVSTRSYYEPKAP